MKKTEIPPYFFLPCTEKSFHRHLELGEVLSAEHRSEGVSEWSSHQQGELMGMGHSCGARRHFYASFSFPMSQLRAPKKPFVNYAISIMSRQAASSSSSSGAGASGKKSNKNDSKKRSFGSAQLHTDMSLEEAEEAGEAMESRAITADCKAKYATMMGALRDFAAAKYPDELEDGELPCPIPPQIVKAFFGTLTKAGSDLD